MSLADHRDNLFQFNYIVYRQCVADLCGTESLVKCTNTVNVSSLDFCPARITIIIQFMTKPSLTDQQSQNKTTLITT